MKTTRTLLGLLCVAGALLAQGEADKGEKGKKSELETLLEEAFKNNPDLRVAEAKLVEVQAELTRARIVLVQKVAKAQADLRAARGLALEAERRYQRDRKLKGTISANELEVSQATAMKYKAEEEAAEAALNAVLGRVSEREKAMLGEFYKRLSLDLSASTLNPVVVNLRAEKKEMPRGVMVDNLRKAMGKKIRVKVDGARLSDLLESMQKEADIKFLAPGAEAGDIGLQEWTFETQTVSAILAFLEDFVENHTFIVRDYGLRVVPKDKVPPGAMTLAEFRKLVASDGAPGEDGAASFSAPIRRIDKDLATVALGSDAGVRKGAELIAWRGDGGTKKVLGKVQVVEVTATSAVVRVVGTPTNPLAVGDIVGTPR